MSEPRSYQRFFAELKRRHVFRVAAVYGAVAFVVLQVADIMVPALALPDAFMRGIALLSILFFPVALVLAWAFEVTPEGVKRTEDAEAGEITQIVEQPPARRWPAGLLALVGVAALATAAWLTLRTDEGSADAPPADAAVPQSTDPERDIQLALSGSEADERPAIAVLPFVDLSPEGDKEYIGDGMTEELLNALFKIRELRVAGRTSTFAYKGQAPSFDDIRDDLGVDAFVEGSIRTDGDRLRITAQLIDTQDGFHLWSDQFDRTLDDIFAIQTEIAEAIAEQMKVSLGLEEGQRLVAVTGDLTAYDLYLQGRARMRERGPGVEEAIELFEAAVVRDSTYAPAWASLAESYTLKPHHQAEFPDSAAWADAFTSAESAARRALALDPENASARVALGSIRRDSWQWEAAEEQLRRALELDPDNVEAQHQYAEFLYGQGRIAEGLEVAHRALSLDPLSSIRHAIVAWGQYLNDDCDAAIATAERGLELDPGMRNLVAAAVSCEMWEGDYDAAEDRILLNFSPTAEDSAFNRSVLAAMRQSDRSLLPEGFDELASPGPMWIALGDTAAAVADAERFLFDPPYGVPYHIWEPIWDSMRGDLWYRDFMRRMDLEGRVPIRTER
jgi:TolB-like protein/Flp pilus assembly protein TadD